MTAETDGLGDSGTPYLTPTRTPGRLASGAALCLSMVRRGLNSVWRPCVRKALERRMRLEL
jgi:hypothetical protein